MLLGTCSGYKCCIICRNGRGGFEGSIRKGLVIRSFLIVIKLKNF